MPTTEQALSRERCTKKDDDLTSGRDVSPEFDGYSIRYVELTRPLAGAFIWEIDAQLSQHAHLTDSALILAGFTIANFIAWLIGEQIIHRLCIYFNVYKKTTSKNPLFRNIKTLANLGFSMGIIFAALDTCSTDLKLEFSLYSATASFIIGLTAFTYRWYRQSLPLLPEHQKNVDAQVGTEGWSKYARVALVFGTSFGQIIGGYVSYSASCNAITSWENITLYGAIVATISFFAIVILVPVINYLTRDKHEGARGILVAKNKDTFNHNYVRSGITLGIALGTILGGLLGPVIISGLTPAVGIAIGSGVLSIISGIALGVHGYDIALYFHKKWGVSLNSENTWSYASRNTSFVFGFIGTAVACVLCPGVALLQSAAMGSAISALIGWFAGLTLMCKVEPHVEKNKKTGLPWVQRIATGANRGSTIGAFVGLAIGLCSGGALGLIACITLVSALGGIFGGIKDGLADATIRTALFGKPTTTSIETPSTNISIPKRNSENYASDRIILRSTTVYSNSAPSSPGHSCNRNILFKTPSSPNLLTMVLQNEPSP